MKVRRGKKSATAPADTAPKSQKHPLRLEWPLLIFPAAVLATLVLLYVLDYSIKREVTSHLRPAASEPIATAAPASRTPDTPAMRRGGQAGTSLDTRPQQDTPERTGRAALVRQGGQPDTMRRGPAAQAPAVPRRSPDGLQGADRLVVILQGAIQDRDQARIKQCLDDLVALGDQVIAPLSQVISNEGGEQGLWAAEALARIGSPVAAATLLDTLSQIKEGPYKEALAKRIAAISNHESWPVLLDNALQTSDSTVLRAAGGALSQMADAPVVDEMIARYQGATDPQEIERIIQLISNIQSSRATESLIKVAGDVGSAPGDPLEQAAVEALGKAGDAQAISYLMRKLEASAPGQGDYLFNTIAQIRQPQAQAALLSAAAGNKEVSAEHGRLAAIAALANYPDSKTIALLEQIVTQEENERVSSAAARTLENIRRTSPHVVANAQSLVKKDPAEPIKK